MFDLHSKVKELEIEKKSLVTAIKRLQDDQKIDNNYEAWKVVKKGKRRQSKLLSILSYEDIMAETSNKYTTLRDSEFESKDI